MFIVISVPEGFQKREGVDTFLQNCVKICSAIVQYNFPETGSDVGTFLLLGQNVEHLPHVLVLQRQQGGVTQQQSATTIFYIAHYQLVV